MQETGSKSPARISIQVAPEGFAFRIEEEGTARTSGWMSAQHIFTTPEFQKRYGVVEIALFTHKCALVPASFFEPASARALLEETVRLRPQDAVEAVDVPEFGAVLLYSPSLDESLSRAIASTVFDTDGRPGRILPELWFVLRSLSSCPDYNKIVASWRDGYLHLAIAQGRSLQLCNCFEAADFTTAEYFIFLAMKKLQLNPEQSVICFRTPLTTEQELSLYRYFKSVEVL